MLRKTDTFMCYVSFVSFALWDEVVVGHTGFDSGRGEDLYWQLARTGYSFQPTTNGVVAPPAGGGGIFWDVKRSVHEGRCWLASSA
jgi:hypothetical protein